MIERNSNDNFDKPFFVNQFVNSVYGVIVGFGFANSLVRIESAIENRAQLDPSISIPFSIVAVLFVLITICVYWWDWVDNVGYRVMNNPREFVIDIAILMSLNFLFFSYEHIVAFSAAFFVLSFLNLLWVYNYRFEEYKPSVNNGNYNSEFDSWSGFLRKNKLARDHIRRRWWGVALYGGCLLFIALPELRNIDITIDSMIIEGWFAWPGIPENWKGHWVSIFLLAFAGLFNRIWLYRDRFLEK
ncbi:MAG: hypothetical protein AB2827_12345 [Candidatus Thiodiazotropha sp.]